MAVESTRVRPRFTAGQVWAWIVEPCPHVTDPEMRQHIRIVSTLMVIVLTLVIVIEMLPDLPQLLADPWRDMDFAIPVATAGLWALVYVLSRRGYYRQATWIAVLTASAAVFLAVLLPYYLEPSYDLQLRFNDLDYLVLALLLASTLLSLPSVRFLAALHVLIILALLVFVPVIQLRDLLRPLSLVTVASVLLMLFTQHRNNLEDYHTTQLVEANQRLRREIQWRQADHQALLVEQQRYRGLFENTNDAVFLLDLAGRIELVNQPALTLMQIAPDQLVGHHYQEFLPAVPPVIREAQRRMLLGQVDLPVFEETLTRPDSSACPVELHVSLVRDSAGEPSHFQALARDLTIRLQVEAQRRALDAEVQRTDLLRDFVSKMSHDLRTPLTTIKAGLYLARCAAAAPEQARTHLDHIEVQVDHLTRVLENMLFMTRLDNPESELSTLTRVAVTTMCRSVLSGYVPRIKELGLDVKIDVPAGLDVFVDVDLMREALEQVVANAFAVVGRGDRIVLRGREADAMVLLEVTNSGPGIAADELPHIFERFYRGDDARRTSTGGLGLGLSIVQRIMELHGGWIEVTNGTPDDPTVGVTVRLAFPVRQF